MSGDGEDQTRHFLRERTMASLGRDPEDMVDLFLFLFWQVIAEKRRGKNEKDVGS